MFLMLPKSKTTSSIWPRSRPKKPETSAHNATEDREHRYETGKLANLHVETQSTKTAHNITFLRSLTLRGDEAMSKSSLEVKRWC